MNETVQKQKDISIWFAALESQELFLQEYYPQKLVSYIVQPTDRRNGVVRIRRGTPYRVKMDALCAQRWKVLCWTLLCFLVKKYFSYSKHDNLSLAERIL